MKSLCTVLAAILLASCTPAYAQDLNIREFRRVVDTRQTATTDKLIWYAGESVDYIILSRRGSRPVSIPEDTLCTWLVMSGTNTYVAETGSVLSSSNGEVHFFLPAASANLPKGTYTSWVQLYHGTNRVGVLDKTSVEVRWRPGDEYTATEPYTNVIDRVISWFDNALSDVSVSCSGGPLLRDFATPVVGPVYIPQATTSGWGLVETLSEQTIGNLIVSPQVYAFREVFGVSFTNVRASVSGSAPEILPGDHFAMGPFACGPSIDYPTIRTGLHWSCTGLVGGATGRYSVVLNTYSQAFERIFPSPTALTNRAAFVGFAPGSLRASIDAQMQARIGSIGKTSAVYSSREPFIRNTNCWAYGIDLSCVSPSNSAGNRYYTSTLVTPQHVVYASHFPADNGLIGSVITFVDMTNGIYHRTVTDRRSGVGHVDCSVAKLDSPLPSSIVPAKILDTNDYSKLLGTNTCPEVGTTFWNAPSPYMFGLRISAWTQDAIPWFVNVDSRDFASSTTLTGYPHSNVVFSIQTIGGDSGTPALLSIRTNLVIAYTHHSYNVGPHIANLATQIEAAMADMGGSIYTNLTRVNLSGWPSYP